jgi:hypothetical protein
LLKSNVTIVFDLTDKYSGVLYDRLAAEFGGEGRIGVGRGVYFVVWAG